MSETCPGIGLQLLEKGRFISLVYMDTLYIWAGGLFLTFCLMHLYYIGRSREIPEVWLVCLFGGVWLVFTVKILISCLLLIDVGCGSIRGKKGDRDRISFSLKMKKHVLLEVELSLSIHYSACNVCFGGDFLYRDS